ncbi:DNRLRE domain-containing protein [Streptomyces nodosus]|uniref:DNRLRE domain-containing protein n=1 Tax=Streptomyces nodosus TaxID=40318 RepID=UPI0034535D4F
MAARLSGKRVEALSERTETSTTWVNKDGSLTTELAAGPVRFMDEASGEWREVDLDLVQGADGSVEPKAHPGGLRLAGKTGTPAKSLKAAQQAKTTDLVTLGEGDQQITLQWKGGLPQPKLDGTRAEYVNAVPGADVIVEATRTGFEQYVELKQRPAIGDADGYSYTLPLKAKGLRAKQLADGSVLFTDKKNKKRAVMPAPVMWDATVDERSGEHTRKARVGLEVVQKGASVDLVITPDAAFLADPATKYPVTIDPSTSSLSNVFDTYVQQGVTVDQSSDTELDWGNPGTKNADGTPRTAQTFISWNTTPIQDALVLDAKLSLWNFHSANEDCTAVPWEVWSSPAASTSSRWTNRPTMTAQKATSYETRGNTKCTSTQPAGWINANVTTLAQEWASAKTTRGNMGIQATSEAVVAQWKRVNSANAATNPPKLVVTYNYRPRTGTDQQAGPPFFKDASTGTWYVNTTTPTLRDTFVDPNNDRVNGTFQIFDNSTGDQVGNVLVSPYVPSGQPASVTVPSGLLANGKTYKFRTSPYDGTHYNTGWSAWAVFTVDTVAPSVPASVTSSDYPADSWVKGVGQAGTFTVTPPPGDQNAIEWSSDDGGTWTSTPTSGSTRAVSFSFTPLQAGTQSVLVRASDKADNKSDSVEYTFHVGPGGVTRPDDGTNTAARLPLQVEADSAVYTGVTFSWRRGTADVWSTIPASDVSLNGSALASWPVSLSSGISPLLTWNATSTVDPDGAVQLRADFTGRGSAAASSDPVNVVVDRAADYADSEEVGPGALNLLTGNFTLSGTDASAFGMSITRTASSRMPRAGGEQEGRAAIFGDEWLAGTTADAVASDYTQIVKTSKTSLNVVQADGSSIAFTATSSGGWTPQTGAESLTLKGAFASGDFTLSDTEGSVVTFAKASSDAVTWTVTSAVADGLANSTTATVSETVGTSTLTRPKKIIAATTATTVAACAAEPSTNGCRVLEFVYATSTTATAAAFGNYSGQVSSIRLWATAPGASTASATTVAQYAYDSDGRLREAWDPRISPALKTLYGYDSAGRVTSVTPAGQLPYTFVYGKAATAPAAGEGMLLSISRATLTPGSPSQTNGTATTTIVYNVPLTGARAPVGLAAQTLATWGQSDLPTDGTAIFPVDQVPSSSDGSTLAATAYTRASLYYLNASGRQVDAANPGGNLSVTEYDRFGNAVRSLSAANRELALGSSDSAKKALTGLGIIALPSAERAQLLSETHTYNADGTLETEALGPVHAVALERDLTSGSTTYATAGSQITAREHIVNAYDQGRPTDGTAVVSGQLTKTTISAQPRSWPTLDADARTTATGYDWAKGLATSSVQDPGGLAITTTTSYDSQGRVTRTSLPASSGSDAGTTVSTYYTADGSGTCGQHPEWADALCQTSSAAAAAGGGSNPSVRPVTTTQYGLYGQPTITTVTAGTSTRTTTITYDTAGRQKTVTITGGLGTAVAAATTTYDTRLGVPVTQSTSDGTITKAYDQLGRQISYTDADGATTTTRYDALDRPVTITDSAPSTTTYTYDTSVDPRGSATSVTDSVAGTFTARYNADGDLTTQTLPGGFTLTQTYDPAATAITRTYTRASDATIVLSDTITQNIHGQQTTHAGTPGVTAAQAYTYDKAGRLTRTQDTTPDAVCTTRSYSFDANSNRTRLATATAAVNADCTTSGATTTTYTYDTADRLVNTGYTYDAYGRTLSTPTTNLAYYTNDLVQQQTTSAQRQTWTLDPAQRSRTYTTETNTSGTWTTQATRTNHYASDSDSPRWITEDTSGTLTRYVTGPESTLAATTTKTGGTVLQLSNLHGDIALQLPADTSVAPTVLDTDEYGNHRTTSTSARYAWHGAQQRSSDALSGLVLMGVRLYDPTTGRFLSTDPVAGGSCNAYDYACADPQNASDLTGTRIKSRTQKACTQYACVTLKRACDSKHRCSINFWVSFRKKFKTAYIQTFVWTIYSNGFYVKKNSYSHSEFGSYKFHGYWYSNRGKAENDRGWFWCIKNVVSCRMDPGDTVQLDVHGIAWLVGGIKVYYTLFESFSGGGRYT